MTTAKDSAQIALGKFYLHRWEGQVLVDWATSMLAQGFEEEAFRVMAEMEGASRAEQLDQFIRTCIFADIVVYENMELAIRAYGEDLRRRALGGEIELEAAFAQLRPLAYDNTSVVIPGLNELDEDFNLLDSLQPTFHYEEMTKENRQEYLQEFFENLRIEEGPWNQSRDPRDVKTPLPPQSESDFARYAEMVGVIAIILIFILYVLTLLTSIMVAF